MMLRFGPRLIGVMLAGLVLAACAQGPIPQDVYYRLQIPEPEAGVNPAPHLAGVAVVRSFEADGILNERAVAYTASDTQTLGQYNYRFWTDPPPVVVQRELAEHLRAAKVFSDVVTPGYRVAADYEVSGRVARFDETPDATGTPHAVVEVELGLTRLRGLDLLTLRRYRVDVPADGDSVDATAEAMRQALAEVFARFTADLVTLPPDAALDRRGPLRRNPLRPRPATPSTS